MAVSPAFFFLCERCKRGCQNLNSVAPNKTLVVQAGYSSPHPRDSLARSLWGCAGEGLTVFPCRCVSGGFQPGGTGQPLKKENTCIPAFFFSLFMHCLYRCLLKQVQHCTSFSTFNLHLNEHRDAAPCRLPFLGTENDLAQGFPHPHPITFASASWATGLTKKKIAASKEDVFFFRLILKCCPVPPRKFMFRGHPSQCCPSLAAPNGVHFVKCARRL